MSGNSSSSFANLSTAGAAGWVVNSAGVIGLLTAVGFLVDVSFQSLLGIKLWEFSSVPRYLVLAGEFTFDTLSAVVNQAVNNVTCILALAAITALLVWVRKRWDGALRAWGKKGKPIMEKLALREVQLMGLALLTSIHFAVLDLPNARIHGVLVRGVALASVLSDGTSIGSRAHDIFVAQICSRISNTRYEELRQRNVSCEHGISQGSYKSDLETRYVANLILAFFGLVWLVQIVVRAKAHNIHSCPWFLRFSTLLVAVVAVGADTVGLLVSYAKTIKSTVVNEVVVQTGDTGSSIASHGYLLYEDKDMTVLFYKGDSQSPSTVRQFLYIPTSKVALMRVERQYDVFTDVILVDLASSAKAPEILPAPHTP